ncbi:flagellar export protein FliJ [Cellulomonas sp. P22]|uniref:flagellar export protein FliJ n=1 Tax=Cellulomonas sp. P22 TaxID=3373189 RepID=UPI0037A5562C
MSRPFRLAGLLRLRTLAEDQAAVELARAVRQRDAAEDRRHETETVLGSASLPARSDELHWRAAVASRAALSGLLVEHSHAVVAAQAVVVDSEGLWSQARTATRTLEKLEERHDTEVRAEEARAEQAVLDEVAGRMRTGVPTQQDGSDR